jgi:hypothetical protein
LADTRIAIISYTPVIIFRRKKFAGQEIAGQRLPFFSTLFAKQEKFRQDLPDKKIARVLPTKTCARKRTNAGRTIRQKRLAH